MVSIIGLSCSPHQNGVASSPGLSVVRNYWSLAFVSTWLPSDSNTVGNIASVASVDWGLAVHIMAAASIGSNHSFTPTTAQTLYVIHTFSSVQLLCCWPILKCSLCCVVDIACNNLQCQPKSCCSSSDPFHSSQYRVCLFAIILFFSVTLSNVRLCLVLIIGLPLATPGRLRNDAAYVFGDFENCKPTSSTLNVLFSWQTQTGTSWPNGYAFILSFMAPLWAIGKDKRLRFL